MIWINSPAPSKDDAVAAAVPVIWSIPPQLCQCHILYHTFQVLDLLDAMCIAQRGSLSEKKYYGTQAKIVIPSIDKYWENLLESIHREKYLEKLVVSGKRVVRTL